MTRTLKLRRVGSTEFLYDLSVDPTETTDFLGDPAYAAVVDELRAVLDDAF